MSYVKVHRTTQLYSLTLLTAWACEIVYVVSAIFRVSPPAFPLLRLIPGGVSLAGLILMTFRSNPRSARVKISFTCIAMVHLSVWMGDWIRFLGWDTYFHSSGDSTFYVAHSLFYPATLLAFLMLPRSRATQEQRLKWYLEDAILFVSLLLGYWHLFFLTSNADQLSAAILAGKKIILATMLPSLILAVSVLCVRDREMPLFAQSTKFIILAGFNQLAADYFALYLVFTHRSPFSPWSETGWMTCFNLVGLACLIGVLELEEGTAQNHLLKRLEGTNRHLGKIFPGVPYVLIFIGYLLLVQSRSVSNSVYYTGIAVGVGLMIILSFLRLRVEYLENIRLNGVLSDTLSNLQEKQRQLFRSNASLHQEITERVQVEEQLAYAAVHDWLTGLPNRVFFLERLSEALEYTRQHDDIRYSVLFLDLDQFKMINDSLGHQAGDLLLVTVTKRLKQCVRISDVVARFGGDEFVFLLENENDGKSITPVTDRILRTISLPYHLNGQTIFTSASIGVVYNIASYGSAEDIIRDADTAMYHAKGMGKSRAELFEPDLRSRAVSRLELEYELHEALEKGQFSLRYQPIVSLPDAKIVGFEALVRWNHPTRGLVMPGDFIGVAEDSDLILQIGRWILYEACLQMKYWQGRYEQCRELFINVNISGKQFSQTDFVDLVKQMLDEVRLPPESLKLEITESTLIGNYTVANVVFNQLAEMGIQCEIDDFGTGYSSIEYLRHFPIHTVKIDKTFVRDLAERDSHCGDLIQTMIDMSMNLGMDTIAEGVETREQKEKLSAMKCKYGQGYYFSRPLSVPETEALLDGEKGSGEGETEPKPTGLIPLLLPK